MKRRTDRGSGLRAVVLVGVAAATVSLAIGGPARAYDPATTHAGLTERSVLASALNKMLARRLSRPLGLFEPVALDVRNRGRYVMSRLMALDPSHGYRPSDDGVNSALGWIVAGSVVAGTPAERGQNTFFDPSRGRGLHQGGSVAEMVHSFRLMLDGGGSMRQIATGTNFNFTGMPSTEWLVSPENDVGLISFYEELDLAVAEAQPAARSNALARALLALGGTLSILQDAGEPAHVRNDFRGSYLGSRWGSVFDRSSQFERHVAEAYGRIGVPTPASAVKRPNVIAYISAADAQGLADRTQRRYFSAGTLPEDGVVDRDTTTHDVVLQARDTLAYGLPSVPRLELREMGRRRYVYATGEDDGHEPVLTATPPARGARRRVLGYERVPGRVRFFLDEAIYADSARALLPEIGAYGAGLIDHLLRAELTVKVSAGAAELSLAGQSGNLKAGKLRIYVEDQTGKRKELRSAPFAPGATVSVAIPAGTRRVAAVLRGEDDAGPVVAVAEQLMPPGP